MVSTNRPNSFAKDLMLEIPAGSVAGKSSVNKFGRNVLISAGATAEIWDGLIPYSFPATALITSISQTTDQVVMRGATVQVQGLDANWDFYVQEAVLDATLTTNVVTLTTPLIRVFRAFVTADVVGDSAIRIHNAGETVDYAVITAGNNQTLMAIYTVPAGKTAYITNYYCNMNPATNKDPTSMQMRVMSRDNAAVQAPRVRHTIGLSNTGNSYVQQEFVPYKTFTEKTDIYIDGAPVGKAADISAGFDLILVDN